jgi:hypothetical protein
VEIFTTTLSEKYQSSAYKVYWILDTTVGLEAIRIGDSSEAASLVTAAAAAVRSGAAPEAAVDTGTDRTNCGFFSV